MYIDSNIDPSKEAEIDRALTSPFFFSLSGPCCPCKVSFQERYRLGFRNSLLP